MHTETAKCVVAEKSTRTIHQTKRKLSQTQSSQFMRKGIFFKPPEKDSNVQQNNKSKQNIYKTRQQMVVTQPNSSLPNDAKSLHMRISKKVWQFMYSSIDKHPDFGLKEFDVDKFINKNKLGGITIWDSPQDKDTGQTSYSETRSDLLTDSFAKDIKTSKLKRKVRRKVWEWSKSAIKANEYWNALLIDNNINIDNIHPEKVDLSLINVDALGIENKLLKRTITWLLK